MDDYYEIVGVDRTASREEIDRKIREQLRLWQRRTANADLSRRQEAERRVEQLSQARTVLLDEEQRRQYDRKLIALRASDPVPAGTVAGPTVVDTAPATLDWLSQARRYLAAHDHHSAAHAARAALRTEPNPPVEVWTILARANTELGRLEDALHEAQRAVTLAPDNLEAQLVLGQVLERRQEWEKAYQQYRNAQYAHPHAEGPSLGIARTLAGMGRPELAVSELEQRFGRAPDPVRSGPTLARGLVEAAEVSVRSGVRTVNQLVVAQMLARAREMSADPAIRVVADRVERQLARITGELYQRQPAARSAYSPPPFNVLAAFALGLSLVGLVTCVTAPIGAVLGHVAQAQIRDRGERGQGVALAAMIVGWLLTAVIICGGLVYLQQLGVYR